MGKRMNPLNGFAFESIDRNHLLQISLRVISVLQTHLWMNGKRKPREENSELISGNS